jgi:Putative prokaryotic signal transducing protein
MAFCPNCEAEYKEGITVCPDCQIELVDELTPENRVHDRSAGEPVALQSFKTGAEAEMVRELLEQNGIRSFVEGGDFAVIPSSFSQEVVVMVDERDLPRAVEIYNAYFDADATAPASEDQTDSE